MTEVHATLGEFHLKPLNGPRTENNHGGCIWLHGFTPTNNLYRMGFSMGALSPSLSTHFITCSRLVL